MGDTGVALIDVEEPYLGEIEEAVRARGWEPLRVRGEAAPSRSARFVLAVVQAAGRDADCLERVAALRKAFPEARVVVIAAGLRPAIAFQLAEAGASDLVDLPAPAAVVTARCIGCASASPRPADGLAELIGESAAMKALRTDVALAARTSSTVLITGETGTGKSLIARLIHRASARSGQPWVHADCSALAPTVIESELFGHERGAFTGATHPRPGRFELAGDGDLLLDEIGELDLALQAKFLRALEDREFERVGGVRTLRLRARIMAATNRDLESDLAAGRFRADLYHRLRVVHLRVPALRDRAADLPLLVESLVRQLADRLGAPAPRVAPGFLDALEGYGWPGNVRELANLLESALSLSRPVELEAEHAVCWLGQGAQRLARGLGLMRTGATASGPASPNRTRPSTAERGELLQALVEAGGNVARVARRMGMPRSTLRYKIRGYELGRYIPRD